MRKRKTQEIELIGERKPILISNYLLYISLVLSEFNGNIQIEISTYQHNYVSIGRS